MTAKGKKGCMFIESFRTFDTRLFHAMLFDLICLMIFFGIAAYYYMYFGRITEAYPNTILSEAWYILALVLLTLAVGALYVLNAAIFKRFVYRFTVEKTQDMKTWLKFSLAWCVPWLVIFVFVIYTMKDEWRGILLFIVWLVYVMLTAIARSDMRTKIGETVVNAFSKFFQWRMLVAYILSGVVFIAAFLAFGWTYIFGQAVFASALFLMFLLYSAWARYYISLVVNELE